MPPHYGQKGCTTPRITIRNLLSSFHKLKELGARYNKVKPHLHVYNYNHPLTGGWSARSCQSRHQARQQDHRSTSEIKWISLLNYNMHIQTPFLGHYKNSNEMFVCNIHHDLILTPPL